MSIRSILRDEKLKHLEDISEQVETLRNPFSDLDSNEMLISFIQLQSLIMLYGEIEKLREFPFETGTLQKVISAALLPVVLQIVFTLLSIS